MKKRDIGRFFASRTGRLVFAIVSFCVLFIILIWTQIFTELKSDKAQAISGAIQRNSNLAVSLEQYTIRTIRNADAVLQLVKKEYAERGNRLDFAALFGKGIIDTGYFYGVSIIDSSGSMVASNLPLRRQLRFDDRPYFQFHKTHADSLHISEPFISRTIQKPVIVISRRMSRADGRFAGVIVVQIEPSTFTSFYAKANLHSSDIISLISPNGITYARRTGSKESFGENISTSPLFGLVARNPVSNYLTNDALRGIPTYFSYRKLQQYPIIATVGSGQADVLADYQEREDREFTFGIVLTVLLLLFSYFIGMVFNDRKKFFRTIKNSEAKYRSVFDNSQDAIILLNNAGELTAMNQAGFGMFRIDEEALPLTATDLFSSSQPKICFKPDELVHLAGDKTEINFLRNDGSEFIGELAHSGFKDAKGNSNFIVLVRDISMRKQMQRRLMQEQKRYQRMLTKEVILAQEREREAIGYELHDNVNQILTTVKLFLEMAVNHPDMQQDLLPQSIRHIQECIREIRHLSHALSAPTLGTNSLVDSIKALIETVETSGKFAVNFHYETFHLPLQKDQTLALYRILQEQLNNIIKHSGASVVDIRLVQNHKLTQLSIADNGKGFNPDDKRNGIGFNNMLSRAKVFGGEMKINSSPGKGCTIQVSIPLLKPENAVVENRQS